MAHIPIVTRSLFSRLFSSYSGSYARRCLPSELKLGDWAPPVIAPPYPEELYKVDTGRWIFSIKIEHLPFRRCVEHKLYAFYVDMLAKIVGREKAEEMIYLISSNRYDLGFCAFMDRSTAMRIKVENTPLVDHVKHDIYYEERFKHPNKTRPMKVPLKNKGKVPVPVPVA